MRGKCWNCDQYGHRKAECPQIRCFRCKNLGHMARECPGRLPSRSPSPVEFLDDWEDEEYGHLSRSYSSLSLQGRGRSSSRGRDSCPRRRSKSTQRELQRKETELLEKERQLQEKEKALQQERMDIQQQQVRMARAEAEKKRRERIEQKRREEEEKKRREREEQERKEEEDRRRALEEQKRQEEEEAERKRREQIRKLMREEQEKKRREREEQERKEEEDRRRAMEEQRRQEEETERKKQEELQKAKAAALLSLSPIPKPRVSATASAANSHLSKSQVIPTDQPSPTKPAAQSSPKQGFFRALKTFWEGSPAPPDDSPNCKASVSPGTTKVDTKEPLETVTISLTAFQYKVIEKFYFTELKDCFSARGALNIKTLPLGSKLMEFTNVQASLVNQKVVDIKKTIRENSCTWKLSTSATFANLPASQLALVVSGTKEEGLGTVSDTVETSLSSRYGVEAVLELSVVPPSRNASDILTVTSKSITSVDKVDVLVSVVGSDLSMRKTSVGLAVLRACDDKQGKQLRSSVRANVAQVTDSDVSAIRTSVPVGTLLPASCCILHAVLSTYQEGGHLKLRKIVNDCLTHAANKNLKTIAFPPLGLGRRFQYPAETVAKDMVSAALDFLKQPSSIKSVIFATNDTSVASMFKSEIQEQTAGKNTGDVEATICVKDKENLARATNVLAAMLKNSFLAEVTICDASELHELGSTVLAEVQKAAAQKGVRLVQKSDAGGRQKLVARGTPENSQSMADFVKGKMYEGLRCKREASFATTHSLPSYWQLNQSYGSVQDAIAGLEQQHKKFVTFPVNSTERTHIAHLINRTWKHGAVGLGKDARNLGHSGIQIVEVRRLENPELWEKYSEKKEKLLRRLKKSGRQRLQGLEFLPGNSGPVLTTSHVSPGSVLQREVCSEVNEHYLFHGTKEGSLVAIERDGLDGRFAKEKPLLGRGVYAAESPTKADQYTDPSKTERTGGQKTMLLVRMLLGEPYLNQERNPPKFERPPCQGCHQVLCTCLHVTHYDSVVDDAGRLFREFVVYEQCQCYPEYIITYTRV